jgi:hypothetical protein
MMSVVIAMKAKRDDLVVFTGVRIGNKSKYKIVGDSAQRSQCGFQARIT